MSGRTNGRIDALAKFFILFLFYQCLFPQAFAQVSYEDSKTSSLVIGKWISKATGHYDFLSATSVAVKRAGSKFFGRPDLQFASDYGFSHTKAPRSDEVTDAYNTIGVNTSSMKDSLNLSRFHMNFGMENKHDLTFSYLTSITDEVSGWGLGYKRVIFHTYFFYFTYRVHYGQAEHKETFKAESLLNDFSASLYFRLIDFYAGARHWSGKVVFRPSEQVLKLPAVEYFSNADEVETYYGVVLATSTNSRLAIESNTLAGERMVTAKFSLRFDSILPTRGKWFRDPRYIKQ